MSTSLKMPTMPMQTNTAAVEEQVLEILRGLLTELGSHRAAQSVSLDSSLDRDLGLGSLERVELLVRFESQFKVRLPDDIAQQASVPAEWVRGIVQAIEGGPLRLTSGRVQYQIEQPAREAPPAPESARNWVEVLRGHAEVDPRRVHIHLLENDVCQDIRYGELLEMASRVASGLRAAGLRRNDTVAIMLPTCADFFYAFFGVMLAGGIPVPIYPPARPDKIEEYVRRQVSILRNAEVRLLIGFERVKAVSKIIQLSIPSLMEITSVDTLVQSGGNSPASLAGPSDIAFIQYTSGSTGEPKGVVLSQFNVLANVQGIGWAVKVRPTDIVVSWLPLYHDMGLIGSWLFSVYYGLPMTIFSPLEFLGRPERWLWALHNSRGTLCPAPNFSYELCARKIPERVLNGLNLSSWRVAINAGEAVLPETLARFAERFQPYGFRPESYVPCYGLAESSVALTFPPIGRRPVIDAIRRDVFETQGKAVPAPPGDPNALRFVSNGGPMPGHEVKIVDDQGQELGERVQGRLFFRGPSRTAGYYRNPEATAAVTTDDGWMDSGDLAYWADGELYITGRSKDCIIKAGRNIIPQEVESVASEVTGVRRGCVAAFGSLDSEAGTERLVVVAETRATLSNELERIEAEIVKGIDAVLGIPPDRVVLTPPHSIPKTSSGKIRRSETRLLYESGGLRGTRKPPWVQIARLTLENLGTWLRSALRRVASRLHRAYVRSLRALIACSSGLLIRLIPGQRMAARIVHGAARWIFRLSQERVRVERMDLIVPGQPVVLFANRAGRFDPLLLAASLPPPFFLADASHLAYLPRDAAYLLKPVVLAPLDGDVTPPGGTLRQRIRQGLKKGHSILVLSDGPSGAPPHLSRFRLDAIHAAAVSSAPIHPVGVQGSSRLFEPGGQKGKRERARVVIGEAFHPEPAHQRELVVWRDRVREKIVRLCGPNS